VGNGKKGTKTVTARMLGFRCYGTAEKSVKSNVPRKFLGKKAYFGHFNREKSTTIVFESPDVDIACSQLARR